ncbi:RusA family crossover junction endodeoxyribonuclease [Pleomorphomonas sp. T1.2MG-36]|uniref:RusA family crossover junction endodeoxyribonuclease n=1 Tax=Pleomorphomonas sp. T1.2MG-36 TaxID=3041167 RepID=UPI002540188D|nr:RusA family crossover junction endodeoxyribonuclease [Pleomorphomonas sp. T1.2MG-36]
MDGDVDNIVKPILDAMIGATYVDDKSIERVVAQKFEPDIDWSFAEPSEQLSAALDAIYASEEQAPVVYIRIDNDLSWRRL